MRLRIFTDGACSGNPGPGGWATVINLHDDTRILRGNEKHTTNNRMELTAALEAIKSLPSHIKKGYDTIEIYSDSTYVINAINKDWIFNWKMKNWETKTGEDIKNKDLWKEFFDRYMYVKSLGVNITFIKVKGHSGNTFNEMCDEIARMEAKKAKL